MRLEVKLGKLGIEKIKARQTEASNSHTLPIILTFRGYPLKVRSTIKTLLL